MAESESKKEVSEPFNFEGVAPEEFYQRLINEAPYVAGDDLQPCNASQIEWLNPKLVREGQEFIKRNSFALLLAHTGALLFGFSFKTLTSVLLRTGGFGLGDTLKSMIRHVETGTHINKWYLTDILDINSQGFKDIQIVRKMHTRALKRCQTAPLNLVTDAPKKAEKLALIEAIKKDLDACIDTTNAPQHVLTYHPKLYFSQFDMAMTQYGFFSIVLLFPESLGVNKKGLEGFIHLWAVFGRMLGIEDRFNVALYPHRELHLKLLYNLALPSLKDMDLTILYLQQTYIDSLSEMLLFSSLKSSFLFGLQNMKKELPALKGDNLYALMTWRDKLWCFCLRVIAFLVCHVDIFRAFMNAVIDVSKKTTERKLMAKYPNKFKPSVITQDKKQNVNLTKIIHQRA